MCKLVQIIISMVFLGSTLSAEPKSPIVIRAAIDMGTGGPKLQVAEVDSESGKIVKMLYTERFFVNFHDNLTNNHELPEAIQSKGHEAFLKAVEKAKTFNPHGIVAVATAAFRHATNGMQFAQEIQKKSGIKVHVIDQKLEGELPFMAVLAKTNTNPEDLVVWDIGGGSTQFVVGASSGCHIDGSKEGSGPFKNHIIEKIKRHSFQECKSPNPLSAEEVHQAKAYARSLSEQVDRVIKAKINHPTQTVVGVGSVFGVGIAKTMGKSSFTQKELGAVVNGMINKTDAEFGGDDFACVEVSNAILALGFMEGLQIEKMQIINVNNADGALIYQPFWQP